MTSYHIAVDSRARLQGIKTPVSWFESKGGHRLREVVVAETNILQGMTREAWKDVRDLGIKVHPWMAATIDDLFAKVEKLEEYRKRTKGMLLLTHKEKDADGVARELGIE